MEMAYSVNFLRKRETQSQKLASALIPYLTNRISTHYNRTLDIIELPLLQLHCVGKSH